MDTLQSFFKVALQSYTTYLLGFTIPLGIGIIFMLHKPGSEKGSLAHNHLQARAKSTVTPSETSKLSLQTPSQSTKQERTSPVSLSNTQPSEHNGWSGTALHALIIGIDKYPQLTPLAGAVADAQRVETFLSADLRVPKGNILTLYDQDASREAIVTAFETLQKNPRIRRGDPIVIFFSGHGGETKAQPEWKRKHGTSTIQVIFPYDYELPIANTNNLVNCIPDTTIANLLNQLADAKGNNITVIFDSCHSASGTRDVKGSSGLRARSAEIKSPIPPDIDDDILVHSSLGSKATRGVERPLHSDQASHILIAACGSNQKAWENNENGLFTSALLDTLRRSRVDNITYENLIKELPALPSQYPHCYGQNKNRVLFGSRLDIPTMVFIPVDCVFEAGRYKLVLQAGEGSGVTENSLWNLHESAREDSRPCARAIAGLPEVMTTPLELENQNTKWLDPLKNKASGRGEIRIYARRLRAGQGTELKVWCSSQNLQDLLSATSPNATSNTTHEFGYVIAKDRNDADIEIEVASNTPLGARLTPSSEVLFRLCDPIAKRYGLAELKHRKPAIREEIETVLFAAAKWKWHLQRINQYPGRTPQVDSMRMTKVATKVGTRREYLDVPMIMEENPRGLVEFVVKPNDLYGIELMSRARSPLYIRMFYFDATDFSIGDMFGYSVARGTEDAILPAGGKIVIGDGQDGGAPLKFTLSGTNKLELGYLKAFWCTSPLELSDLAQKSAFEMRPGTMGRAVGRAMSMPQWGTLSLTLVLKAA
ncbi:hypothetical protein OPQ81_003617 [Rhizoctonia solani]|nr:hypothetical protein OPQ81_003617 [Rhizoctonia solani]